MYPIDADLDPVLNVYCSSIGSLEMSVQLDVIYELKPYVLNSRQRRKLNNNSGGIITDLCSKEVESEQSCCPCP